MTVHLITRLKVSDNLNTILFISEEREDVVNFMHNYIEKNYDKNNYISYVKSENRILKYKKNIGYFYNNKELEEVLQICSYEE